MQNTAEQNAGDSSKNPHWQSSAEERRLHIGTKKRRQKRIGAYSKLRQSSSTPRRKTCREAAGRSKTYRKNDRHRRADGEQLPMPDIDSPGQAQRTRRRSNRRKVIELPELVQQHDENELPDVFEPSWQANDSFATRLGKPLGISIFWEHTCCNLELPICTCAAPLGTPPTTSFVTHLARQQFLLYYILQP